MSDEKEANFLGWMAGILLLCGIVNMFVLKPIIAKETKIINVKLEEIQKSFVAMEKKIDNHIKVGHKKVE